MKRIVQAIAIILLGLLLGCEQPRTETPPDASRQDDGFDWRGRGIAYDPAAANHDRYCGMLMPERSMRYFSTLEEARQTGEYFASPSGGSHWLLIFDSTCDDGKYERIGAPGRLEVVRQSSPGGSIR